MPQNRVDSYYVETYQPDPASNIFAVGVFAAGLSFDYLKIPYVGNIIIDIDFISILNNIAEDNEKSKYLELRDRNQGIFIFEWTIEGARTVDRRFCEFISEGDVGW